MHLCEPWVLTLRLVVLGDQLVAHPSDDCIIPSLPLLGPLTVLAEPAATITTAGADAAAQLPHLLIVLLQ